jgi:hypothetical protein
MSELTITGSIKEFLPVERGIAKSSGKEWQKQFFIVANNDGYEGKEQIFCFEVFGEDKVTNLTKFQKEGDAVKVSFNIGTNEWNGKYFTSLSAWRIEKLDAIPQQEINQDSQVATSISEDEPDDLPF